eukprot:1363152-Amorphochlora_amoeboformis.AAC.1
MQESQLRGYIRNFQYPSSICQETKTHTVFALFRPSEQWYETRISASPCGTTRAKLASTRSPTHSTTLRISMRPPRNRPHGVIHKVEKENERRGKRKKMGEVKRKRMREREHERGGDGEGENIGETPPPR